jgi:tRNA(Ile)-lysidine synthase
MRSHFEAKVAAALDRIGVGRGERILLALSGGADSVALFHALVAIRDRLGLIVTGAHFNHHLRGEESDRDESFVRELCAQTGVELVVEDAEGLCGSNLEERARELRYDFLSLTADRLDAARIALGHHADDQAETVLIRLLRGTGVSGLKAMAPAGPGRLIRPLLCFSRAEILEYVGAIGTGFVIDSTNSSTAILRNRLRANLIPELERGYAPGLGMRLVELATEMESVDDLIGRLAGAELDHALGADGALDLSGFAKLHPALAAAVIREFIRMRRGSLRRVVRAHIESVRRLCIEGPPNGRICLPDGWYAERQYGTLRLQPAGRAEGARSMRPCAAPAYLVPIDLEGSTAVGQTGFVFEGSIVSAQTADLPQSPLEALFDADLVAARLCARNFAPGDRIRPLGMTGTRKVKDVFIDRKVPRPRRAELPLVVAGEEVLWIPGLMRSRGALVTPDTTRVVRLKAQNSALRGF